VSQVIGQERGVSSEEKMGAGTRATMAEDKEQDEEEEEEKMETIMDEGNGDGHGDENGPIGE
jgi:hypothetical protein